MENIIKELKVLKPNLIYIGLPTPYKEDIAIRLRKDLDFGCIVLIGGMFDVFAGEKKIGYKIVSYLCLDWFFRMIQEPRRLFRRYMSSNCYFVYMILKEFLISK
jgi:N-acetylglucosaminyldiphosphoundecaprenol N-acetyl-beta-D-mannosaminyltransferase